MILNRLKKKLIELGQGDYIKAVEEEYKQKQMANKKPKRIKNLEYTPIKYAFKLAYIGIKYQGLESQINQKNTIETEIFGALQRLRMIENRDDCDYTRAGRTDKGVSAMGNVITLKIRRMGTGLNAEYINRVLPEDIQILDEVQVPDTFNARYDCIKRVYKYYFFRGHYNTDLITQSAEKYIGEHDFRNFCKIDVVANQTFVRNIMNVKVEQVHFDQEPRKYHLFQDDDRFDLFCCTIEGNAFLWHQIRYMMAVLFLIGRGDEEPDVIEKLLLKTDGRPNIMMAPDYPLVLWDCQYKAPLFNPNSETHNILFMDLYERMREKLNESYIEFIHFYQMGQCTLGAPKAPEKPRDKKQSILTHKSEVTVENALQNLKGKRRQKYDQKIERVREYQSKQQQ